MKISHNNRFSQLHNPSDNYFYPKNRKNDTKTKVSNHNDEIAQIKAFRNSLI